MFVWNIRGIDDTFDIRELTSTKRRFHSQK